MTIDDQAAGQLRTIAWLHAALAERDIDYWLFGGWACDFHLGRVTRNHADVDLAVWQSDLSRLGDLLLDNGWVHVPEPGEAGYTSYQRGDLRVELAFLERDEAGEVYTPLAAGRGEWPPGSFGDGLAEVNGVQARVIHLAALIVDKSGPRDDPAVAAKDAADVALLASLPGTRLATGRA